MLLVNLLVLPVGRILMFVRHVMLEVIGCFLVISVFVWSLRMRRMGSVRCVMMLYLIAIPARTPTSAQAANQASLSPKT